MEPRYVATEESQSLKDNISELLRQDYMGTADDFSTRLKYGNKKLVPFALEILCSEGNAAHLMYRKPRDQDEHSLIPIYGNPKRRAHRFNPDEIDWKYESTCRRRPTTCLNFTPTPPWLKYFLSSDLAKRVIMEKGFKPVEFPE
jgi:hypothetical protein